MPPRLPSLGQLALQQAPWYTTVPLGQAQVLPQPSDMLPRLPSAGQFGMQQPFVTCVLPEGQGHLPLQPSSMPARLPSLGQVGVQTQLPCTHLPALPQLVLQWQVSRQVPLLQRLPTGQVTPAHRFWTHWPPAQTWFAAQVTPAQGFGAAHDRLQAIPGPQAASHALSATHLPLPGLQVWPDGHVTPLQGSAKQPGVQLPATQVCPPGQVTPAQGSVIATQLAWQVVPVAQVIADAARQGSDWQLPPRQTWPVGHFAGHMLPDLPAVPDVPA
jgi:hypothetical protein